MYSKIERLKELLDRLNDGQDGITESELNELDYLLNMFVSEIRESYSY